MVNATMHQNAQICMLKFKIFPGLYPGPHIGEGLPIGTPRPLNRPQCLLSVDATKTYQKKISEH